jgi:phosphatidylglycerol lysyltransferase
VLALLRRHGTHATSFQILETGYRYWFEDDAVVAYVKSGRWCVVAGVPICESGTEGAVASRFVSDAATDGLGVLFFSADDDFVSQLQAKSVAEAHVKIGEQPEWDPRTYDLQAPRRRSLRAQVNRATNKGVQVRRLDTDAMAPGALRAQIETVLNLWIAARTMSAMRFMVDLQPFSLPEERRYYIATHEDRVVGFLAAIPVYRRRGWFFEDVIRVPNAPNGTTEMLINTALTEACDNGDQYVTLGLSPLAGLERGPGPHRLIRACFQLSWDYLGPLYHFPGLYRFKGRFRPDRWAPQYLVACPPRLGLRQVHAVLSAFAGAGLLSFGIDTARRLLSRTWKQLRGQLWSRRTER